MDIVHPAVTEYLEKLWNDDEPVLLEMEELAKKEGFPIIGRVCGRFLEVMARFVGAKRVFEMGSGYGYSAYWFSKAVGPAGEIHLTDTDSTNEKRAADFLARAGLDGPVTFHLKDAFEALDSVAGEFDVVYCDIDKGDYPRAWETARSRVRIGGCFISDNMLWSGRVTGAAVDPDARPGWTAAIAATNEAIAGDPAWRSFIFPARDGVIAALRTQ